MKRRRTLTALGLVLLAVAVPALTWLWLGLEQDEKQAAQAEEAVRRSAQESATTLALGLAERLETLRRAESQRPFYHYQNLLHDPRGAAEGAAVTPSPLARGPVHPLIEAHFQVNEEGRLSLPTLNEDLPELQEEDPEQCALLHRLQEVAVFSSRNLWGESGLSSPIGETHIEELTRKAWQQHRAANALYGDLKYREAGGRRADRALAAGTEKVQIPVQGFTWHTLPVAGRPSLVALRGVETPDGPWQQGFVVSPKAAEEQLRDPRHAVLFEPARRDGEPPPSLAGEPQDADSVAVAMVNSTGWWVRVDPSAALAQARLATAQARARFLRVFLLAVLASLVAGSLVVAMVHQADHLAAERARFAAHAAHELRTPLASLRLYSEMLAEGLGDPQRSGDYARRLASEAERLGRVVTNVLSFTRLEQKSLTLRPEIGDLRAAVEEAVARQRPALEQAGAKVDLDLRGEVPEVAFDRDALGQILQNLLDNGEKYTRGIPDRCLTVSLAAHDSAVDLSVQDNGPGIPRRLRRRLFRPFVRGGEEDSPEGVGLGLVLVRALASAQGARVAYADGPSGGARFTLSFPL